MKKILSAILVLCLMMTSISAFAESGEDKLSSAMTDLIADILQEKTGSEANEDGTEIKTNAMILLISLLKTKLNSSSQKMKTVLSGLKKQLEQKIEEGKERSGSVLSKLKNKLTDVKDSNFGDLLIGLLGEAGGLSEWEWTEEDQKELEETLERLNREDEAETGEQVPNRKAAESVEAFYGRWKETKCYYAGEKLDLEDEENEGVYIGENTYYRTLNGEKSEDYIFPETAELTIRDGVLKINSRGNWTTYVMTLDDEIVQSSGNLMVYYVRENDK